MYWQHSCTDDSVEECNLSRMECSWLAGVTSGDVFFLIVMEGENQTA
jgi:hypothetical protein